MDHRDRVATYGTELSSLPDVEINTDSMTATFSVEAEPPEPPPPPPPSRLEQIGSKVDAALSSLIDRVTEKLHEKGAFQKTAADGKRYSVNEYHEWFPKCPQRADSWYYPQGFRDLAKLVVKQRSVYHLFRCRVNMHRHWTPPGRERRPNALLLDFHVFDSTRYFPHLNVWFATNCSGPGYNDYKIRPFQFGLGRTPLVR